MVLQKAGKERVAKNEKNEKGKERGRGKAGERKRGKEIEICLEMHAATSGFGLKIRDVFDASMA